MESDKPDISGEQAAKFFRLFIGNQKRIYGYIISMVPNATEADDLLQETATVMWAKFAQFQTGSSFTAWGIRIAHNHILYYYRKKRTSKVMFSDKLLEQISQFTLEAFQDEDDRIFVLRKCLTRLNDKDRTLVDLRYRDNLAPKQIAQRVSRSVDGVYKSLARIHHALLSCVRQQLSHTR